MIAKRGHEKTPTAVERPRFVLWQVLVRRSDYFGLSAADGDNVAGLGASSLGGAGAASGVGAGTALVAAGAAQAGAHGSHGSHFGLQPKENRCGILNLGSDQHFV